ncbi:Sir2 family NAD-dependent protein deacetylase [Actinoplanes sp. NPDC049548]|uniref:SIR2 family NAD-dependent protein deacylase n=1 Tax=Actinoplanes sp. NPDC049548 TaxID=3155152 RepID=UPI00342C9FA9
MDMSWADGVTRVAVLTGAGISTDSGIPDYRGPDGVWTRDPSLVDAFTYQSFMADADVRARFWRTYAGHPAWTARPNAAHRALADLERGGFAVRVLTQNVDGLHQKAGSSPRKVLELHGSIRETVCTGCGARTPTAIDGADGDRRCAACGGILKLGVVMFGEHLDPDTVGLAERIASHSELMLVVGSSLQVEPVASLCAVAVNGGNRLVIVNRDPTPYDSLATAVVREPIGTVVPRICAALSGGGGSSSANEAVPGLPGR